MADYQNEIEKMSRDQLLNELIYHAQRISYHAIRMEERFMSGTKMGLSRDYRFEWMGEEIRYVAKCHTRIMEVAKQEEMEDIRATIARGDA